MSAASIGPSQQVDVACSQPGLPAPIVRPVVLTAVRVLLTAISGPAAHPPRQPVDTNTAPRLSPTAARSAGSPSPAGPLSSAPQRCPAHTVTHRSTCPDEAVVGELSCVVTLCTLTIIADKGKVWLWTSSGRCSPPDQHRSTPT